MKDTLKPCPFCGGIGIIAKLHNGQYYPRCQGLKGCFCLLARHPDEKNDGFLYEDDAIKVWNRRHDTSELITLRAQLAEATARAEKAEADRHWLIGQIENQTIVLNKYNANEKMLIEKLHNVSAELERMREAIGTLMVDRLPYVDESGKIEIPLMKWGEFLAALDRAALTAPEKLSCDTCGDIVCKRDRENPKVVCPDYAVTAAPEKREVCRWRPVHDGLLYKSGCEKYWSCEESISPIEAGMKYCSYCGLPIVEEKE